MEPGSHSQRIQNGENYGRVLQSVAQFYMWLLMVETVEEVFDVKHWQSDWSQVEEMADVEEDAASLGYPREANIYSRRPELLCWRPLNATMNELQFGQVGW